MVILAVLGTLLLINLKSVVARPPGQTATQAKIVSYRTSSSRSSSDTAKTTLLKIMDGKTFRDDINYVAEIKSKSSQELLEMLYDEIHYADMYHNLASGKFTEIVNSYYSGLESGAPVEVVMKLKYLPTCWAEIAEKIIVYNSYMAVQNAIEVKVFGFPNFDVKAPTLTEAYNRSLYTSINIWKKSGGNFEWGPVGLVVDRTFTADDLFVSPIDTGWYFRNCPGIFSEEELRNNTLNNALNNTNSSLHAQSRGQCTAWDGRSFGTAHDFYHLVMPHLNMWDHTLGQLFKRWYGSDFEVRGNYQYLEAEMCAGFLIPETLKYIVLSFDLFGKNATKSYQSWCKDMRRPLAWALDANAGTVVDASVGCLDGEYHITEIDRKTFSQLWVQRPNFTEFKAKVSRGLHLRFLGAHSRNCNFTACKDCRYIGINSDAQCLYWRSP